MDAKVIRAAVSAAIRVTVSATMIGCGGSVVSEGNGSAGSGSGRTTAEGGQTHAVSAASGEGGIPTYRAPITTAAAGTSDSAAAAAGSSSTAGSSPDVDSGGAMSAGGVVGASGAGPAGETAGAGAPPEVCGSAVDVCLKRLVDEPVAMLSAEAMACCDTVASGLDDLRLAQAECYDDLEGRFMRMPARTSCCRDPATWVHTACAPWGPPVPPEVTHEALLAWGLAA